MKSKQEWVVNLKYAGDDDQKQYRVVETLNRGQHTCRYDLRYAGDFWVNRVQGKLAATLTDTGMGVFHIQMRGVDLRIDYGQLELLRLLLDLHDTSPCADQWPTYSNTSAPKAGLRG